MKRIILTAIIIFGGLSAHQAMAQDIENYSPPPMFGAPPAAPQNNDQTRPIDKLPSVSKEVGKDKLKEGRAVLKPVDNDVAKQIKTVQEPVAKPEPTPQISHSVKTPPLPRPKPSKQVQIASTQQPTNAQDKQLEPIEVINQADSSLSPTLKEVKVTKEGVVKGPKSMPAVGKKDVEVVATHSPDANKKNEPNMFARMKKQREEKTVQAQKEEKQKVALADLSIKPADLETTSKSDIDAMKENYILIFDQGEAELGEKHKNQILDNILPILNMNKGLVLNINAYASTLDDVSFSDRRIALNRALAIRNFLLGQEIQAARINMRSHGFSADKSPADQIEMSFNQIGA